jgi:nucleoside-diphosphate-sugar epimerase
MRFPNAVLFGGTGFIGRHLAAHLLSSGISDRVVLADLAPLDPAAAPSALLAAGERAPFRRVDVRRPIDGALAPQPADLVVNLAAVHREPGHAAHEYFETNLRGAEHVCLWAEAAGCRTVVFTSSISPYGPSETEKSEASPPAPATPYGESKLGAERIHRDWQARAAHERRLVIVRPGVVYGPGEQGNVTRMVRAVLHGWFVYMGNRRTVKAGGYVKELCATIVWVLGRQRASGEGVVLYNFSTAEPATIEHFVRAICAVAGVRRAVPRLPYALVWSLAWLVQTAARPLGSRPSFHPVRVRKLVRSNNVVPAYLTAAGYPWRYTLESALADWKAERPDEWRGARVPR